MNEGTDSEELGHLPEITQLTRSDSIQICPLLPFPENLAWDLVVEDTHPAPWGSATLFFLAPCDQVTEKAAGAPATRKKSLL